MSKALLMEKIGMTQVFTDTGKAYAVTVLRAEKNTVLQVKTIETDGYSAMQIGFREKTKKRSTRPELGHAKKANSNPMHKVKEVRGKRFAGKKLGDTITVDVFQADDIVDVTGISKGKGFQGHIKRHGHSTGPNTHGSRHHRRAGSNGPMQPKRVFKNMKGAGQMGNVQVTMQNLKVHSVDPEKGLVIVRGAIPGPARGVVLIKQAIKWQGDK